METIITHIVLCLIGIKLYLWGKKQQKKYALKWGWRFAILFFFAPIIIFFVDLLLPIPDKGIKILKYIVEYIDYPIVYIEKLIKDQMGWWMVFIKPTITAVFYALIGFIIGTSLDSTNKKKK